MIRSIALLALVTCAWPVFAADAPAPAQVLFTNVHVFDGVNEKRIENANVLVEGNPIKQVSRRSIEAPGVTVIDAGGRTMTPGFTDMHVHVMINDNIFTNIYQNQWEYTSAKGV